MDRIELQENVPDLYNIHLLYIIIHNMDRTGTLALITFDLRVVESDKVKVGDRRKTETGGAFVVNQCQVTYFRPKCEGTVLYPSCQSGRICSQRSRRQVRV